MADTKISGLPASTTPLAGTEVLPIVQSGVTRQVSVANLTAGRAVSAASVTASTGSFVIGTAGQGVDFSANAHPAGMTSELLNDYEEGTWTPNQGSGLTVSGTFSSSGRYTKVGRLVHVTGQVQGSTSIACAAAGILTTNMPYSAATIAAGSAATSNANAGSQVAIFDATVYSMTAIGGAPSAIFFTISYTV
jgi:hypothetical protein